MPDLDISMIRQQAANLAECRGSLEWPAKELPWKVTNHKGSFSASNDAGDEREECDVFESGRESTVAFVVAAVNAPWDEHAVRLCDEVERLRKIESAARSDAIIVRIRDGLDFAERFPANRELIEDASVYAAFLSAVELTAEAMTDAT